MDSDAAAYIAAVETADGQALQYPVKLAIDAFVVGCKADGIWTAIKAACFLAGPATLAGALVPLVGSAPTNVNFVSGDYSQATGLVGNGSTKYLNANRNNNADPQNNVHQSVWVSTASANGVIVSHIGAGGGVDAGATHIVSDRTVSDWVAFRNRSVTFFSTTGGNSTGFIGHTRAASGSYTTRVSGANTARTNTSGTAFAGNSFVFARNTGSPNLYSSARLAWYSIGESLNLALLDARLTTYMTDVLKPITNQRRAAQASIRSTF
jgi:hypothetical protein